MDIIEHLYEVYVNHEWWDTPKVDKHVIDAYHRVMISRGNLICETDNGKLIGYVEVLKISYEQLGRLICKAPFDHMEEDTLDGNIAYLLSVWINPDYRNGEVIKNLREKFFMFTEGCNYFVGEALRKKSQPVKVFNREKLEEFISNKLSV